MQLIGMSNLKQISNKEEVRLTCRIWPETSVIIFGNVLEKITGNML